MADYIGYNIEIKSNPGIKPIYQKIEALFSGMDNGLCVFGHNLTNVFYTLEKEKNPFNSLNYIYPSIKAMMIVDVRPSTIYLILDTANPYGLNNTKEIIASALDTMKAQEDSQIVSVSRMPTDSIDFILGIKD